MRKKKGKGRGLGRRTKKGDEENLLQNFQKGENIMETITTENSLVLCFKNYQPLYSTVLH